MLDSFLSLNHLVFTLVCYKILRTNYEISGLHNTINNVISVFLFLLHMLVKKTLIDETIRNNLFYCSIDMWGRGHYFNLYSATHVWINYRNFISFRIFIISQRFFLS